MLSISSDEFCFFRIVVVALIIGQCMEFRNESLYLMRSYVAFTGHGRFCK